MKKSVISLNSFLFSLSLCTPAQGSGNSSISDESLDKEHIPTTSMPASLGVHNIQPPDEEDWETKAREFRLWRLEQKLHKQGKKPGSPISISDFAT